MIPLTGFAPDLDPSTPGIITDCTNLIPTLNGMAGAPSPIDAGADALASPCRGAAVLSLLNNSRRVFAGTQTGLYELTGTSFIDRSHVVALATPAAASGTGSATGGTLAAGSYYVKIVALDAGGNLTAAGPESGAVTTTGATSSIAYTWAAVSGAASYRIYYGTAPGAESAYYTSASTSFTLTATSGTAGTPPAAAGIVPYTGSSENRWRFSQFGNVSLACNQTEKIQFSSGTTFSDIADAPKARIIETASGFVLAFGINDSRVGGDRPDAWMCSGIYDYATWTPGPGTQAEDGYLLDTPGEIRAAKRLGKDCAVYKERSTYLGRYVGPPVVWAFDLVAANAGAICQEAVIDTGTAHLFIGRDDVWMFDGSVPKPIGAPVKQWFFAHSDNTYRQNIRAYFDQYKNIAWWFYPANGSGGALTDAIVYNLNNGRWGHVALNVQSVLMYQKPDTTYDDWPPGAAVTFDAIPDIPFDSPVFDTSASVMAVFGPDNKIKTIIGPCATASLTTGDIGDDDQFTTLTRVTPRFTLPPQTASLTHSTRDSSGGALSERSTSTLDGNRFEPLASGRWHKLRMDTVGDFEIVGFQPSLSPDGDA